MNKNSENKNNITVIIDKALKNQGRSKRWLARQLEMSEVTLWRKMRDDCFTISEKAYIKKLLDLK